MTVHCVAGIDAHKHSETVAVLSITGALLACELFDMTTDGLAVLPSDLGSTGQGLQR